jgi:hypothetical protein
MALSLQQLSPMFSSASSGRQQGVGVEKKRDPIHFASVSAKPGQGVGFIRHTPLADALRWTPEETFRHLSQLVSPEDFERLRRHETIESPLQRLGIHDSKWLQNTKVIGINPRALGTYFNILKAAMIYPERGIHLLPYYTNDKACIYEPQDWKLSTEFLDPYLTTRGLHTPKQQLAYVINVLHAMGKAVGMDVLPHTAAFSKESFVQPDKFEWFQLNANKTAQLFPQSLQFNSLSPWARERITSYYIQSQASPESYEAFFQKLKANFNVPTRDLGSYSHFQDAIQRVFKLKPAEMELEGWSHYAALLSKKHYVELNGEEKEVFQRVFEPQVSIQVKQADVAAFFQQHLAILKHPNAVTDHVKEAIISFLQRHGDSEGNSIPEPSTFFMLPAEQRRTMLFGPSRTLEQARQSTVRRYALIHELKNRGLYPAPVQDNEVLRPVWFDRMRQGNVSYPLYDKPNLDPACNYEFFGTLTPYAFFPVKDNGYLNTRFPNQHVFTYYAKQVAQLQQELGLDFIRADMAHVQTAHATDEKIMPSASGLTNPYEFLAYTKAFVQKQAPHFAILGESFLWGEKSINLVQDLNNKKIDVASGNLDRQKVNIDFIETLREKTTASGQLFKEALPVASHDTDQAHRYYLNQNPLALQTRYFMHLFQAAPGYAMAGYESRPISTNHSYLFPQKEPFNWGNNTTQFRAIHAMREQAQRMYAPFQQVEQDWLSCNRVGVGAWMWRAQDSAKPKWLMVANTDLKQDKTNVKLSNPFALNPQVALQARKEFSTVSTSALPLKKSTPVSLEIV